MIFENIFNRERNYMIEISNKIELMKLNLDNDYKIMKVDCEFYENIYNNYEKVWESYHVCNSHNLKTQYSRQEI